MHRPRPRRWVSTPASADLPYPPETPAFFIATARQGSPAKASGADVPPADPPGGGLRPRPSVNRPRPHDVSHSFAVRTLLGWYDAGEDMDARRLCSPPIGACGPREHILVFGSGTGAVGARNPGARRRVGRRAHDPARPDPRGVLHRPSDDQSNCQPPTIAAYRDTFRLLLRFAQQQPASNPASWTSPISTRR